MFTTIKEDLTLPSDYKIPEGYNQDLGLLLHREGIKNHSLCFMGNPNPNPYYDHLEFPFSMDENPKDYVNTTFIPKKGLQSKYNEVMGVFQLGLGNQWTWRNKTEKLIPMFEETTDVFCYTIQFNTIEEMKVFMNHYEKSNPLYVSVEVSFLEKVEFLGNTEYFCVLKYKGIEKRQNREEFYMDKVGELV